ncbi:hypothetical protein T02_12460 [Trichinella nativa]|uniref:Uncharacterized protein n=1 Tax=Trichinella nativa TaxID=6335 RepID=A0A0V1LUB2_9BILA|nr:hypothetical protein T02_12460 [Trichinella nativa]
MVEKNLYLQHSLKRLTVSMRCVMFVSETVPKRQYGQKSNANEDDHDCEQEKTMQVLQALASTEVIGKRIRQMHVFLQCKNDLLSELPHEMKMNTDDKDMRNKTEHEN